MRELRTRTRRRSHLEANPENVSPESLVGWLEAGVTRLSIGMQSADPDALTVLQRVHTPGAAVAAARTARTEGFEHISLDLIYGVPGQSLDSWRSTLLSALAGEPDHISAYAWGWNAAPPWSGRSGVARFLHRIRTSLLPNTTSPTRC